MNSLTASPPPPVTNPKIALAGLDAMRRQITQYIASRRCVLLATGEDKAVIVAKSLEGPLTNTVPATALQKHSRCTVVLDEPAASRLKIPHHENKR